MDAPQCQAMQCSQNGHQGASQSLRKEILSARPDANCRISKKEKQSNVLLALNPGWRSAVARLLRGPLTIAFGCRSGARFYGWSQLRSKRATWRGLRRWRRCHARRGRQASQVCPLTAAGALLCCALWLRLRPRRRGRRELCQAPAGSMCVRSTRSGSDSGCEELGRPMLRATTAPDSAAARMRLNDRTVQAQALQLHTSSHTAQVAAGCWRRPTSEAEARDASATPDIPLPSLSLFVLRCSRTEPISSCAPCGGWLPWRAFQPCCFPSSWQPWWIVSMVPCFRAPPHLSPLRSDILQVAMLASPWPPARPCP